jgi:hypothetical protein
MRQNVTALERDAVCDHRCPIAKSQTLRDMHVKLALSEPMALKALANSNVGLTVALARSVASS